MSDNNGADLMDDLTTRLADHAAGLRFDDLPAAAIDKAKQLVLDLLGIALCASVDVESTPSIRDAVLSIAGPGKATAIGTGRTLAPAHAALLNGALGHSLDFDDTHRDGSVHPGAAVIPVVLALAEEHAIDGRRAIAAIVAGYDVTCKLSRALDPLSHYTRGFHPTGTAGVFGATAAGANLLGMSAAELAAAFGINGSQAAASMQFLDNGSWNKRIHPGLAAHNAIFALELSRRGFVGSARPFEGRSGLFHAYSDAARPELLVDALGERFEILLTAIKPYPACRYAHAPLDMLIEIVEANDLAPDDVTSVTIGLSDAGCDIIGTPIEQKRRPQSLVDGQFSMPFLASVALQRRRMAWSDYELVGDDTTNALADRVAVVADAEANEVYPGRWLASLELVTTRGTFTDRRWITHGEPELPMSWDEIEAKFDELAAATLGPQSRRELAAMARGMADLEDLSAIGGPLRMAGREPAIA
jgi:2-methylcitrate dehydratase PrpD